VLDRCFDYSWPVTADALASGEVPTLTHKGRLAYLNERGQNRAAIDLLAVEATLLEHIDLFDTALDPTTNIDRSSETGMTLAEFAEWAGVDRRRIARNLVEVPPGTRPALAPGLVPIRRIGDTRRIFLADFLGDPTDIGGTHARHHQEAAPGSDPGRIHRQVADLRRRYVPRR
jgi:hypothetical protein